MLLTGMLSQFDSQSIVLFQAFVVVSFNVLNIDVSYVDIYGPESYSELSVSL